MPANRQQKSRLFEFVAANHTADNSEEPVFLYADRRRQPRLTHWRFDLDNGFLLLPPNGDAHVAGDWQSCCDLL